VIQVKVEPGNGKGPRAPIRKGTPVLLYQRGTPWDLPAKPPIDWKRVVGITVAGILLGGFWAWVIGKLL
jgi:hypothetical protein